MNRRIRKKLFNQSHYIWYLNNPKLWRALLLEFGNEKEKWIATLKVGDMVEDCRYQNHYPRTLRLYPYLGR